MHLVPRLLAPLSLAALAACVPITDEERERMFDPDGDGVSAYTDCDNQDPTIGTRTKYRDGDGDGFGDEATAEWGCEAEAGWSMTPGDCDDAEADSFPGNPERCDDVDNDCDGEVDNDAPDAATWYPDDDGDGFGDDARALRSCRSLPGYVAIGGDCEDTLPNVNPDQLAICGDALDNDCDSLGDCGLAIDGNTTIEDAPSAAFLANNDVRATAILGVGDLTGDGVQDLLVGASEYAGGDGAVAVLPGPFTGQSGTLDGGWLITGVAKAKGEAGTGLAVGFFDDDEVLDLAVGAPGESSNNGAVRIVSGPITGNVDLGDGDVMGLIGYAGDRAGSVLVADDFDGDLITDLLVGSPGQDSIEGAQSYVDSGAVVLISGPIMRADTIENTQRGVVAYLGEDGAELGGALDSAGDLDNDGEPEIIAGMPSQRRGSTASNNLQAGEVVVFYGYAIKNEIDLATQKSYIFRGGKSATAQFGAVVAGVGDLTGDGYPELTVSAPGGNGVVYVLDGYLLSPMDGGAEDINDYALATVNGGTNAALGQSVAGAGDLDGDGAGELWLGAPGLGGGAGGIYLFLGAELAGTLDAADAAATVTGADGFGAGFVNLGDTNGLGLPDVAVRGSEDVHLLFSDRL